MKNVLNNMDKLHTSLEELISKREEYFDLRTEKWQKSEKGEEFQEKTGRLQEMLDDIIDWQTELGS